MTIGKDLGTVRPCVLSEDQTVEGIVSKALVAARIVVVGDGPDISVVVRAQVEVIDQIHERPDGRGRPQGGGLETVVEAEAVDDSTEAAALAVNGSGQ